MPPQHRQQGQGQPPIVLNVAEKPSVARSLAAVFGRLPGAQDRGMTRQVHQVFRHENVCFPSVYQQGHGQLIQGPVVPHTMITTSVRGHLASQDFPRNYGWSKCDPIALFDAPIETTYRDDMIPLEHMLRTLAATAQVVILWLDCDREGEAIGDEVRQVVLRAHNHNNNNLQVYRAKFSTVLHQEIHRALQSLGRLNEAFVQAVQARSELDLRVGAAFTRFQTLRLQRHFEGFSEHGVVSYGPCQFPTLGFVVERWARIETFIPEDFWYLDLTLKVADDDADQQQPPAPDESSSSALTIHSRPGQSSGGSSSSSSRPINFTWKRGRLYDQLLTSVLYEMCLDDGQAVVTSMEGRPKNKWRPVPLATVELQKRASMYLRIGSEQLMSAAEELYQQGLITYPRTETERFRPEFQHQPLIQQLAGLAGGGGGGGGDYSSATAIGAYAAKLLTNQHFQNPRAGQHDDQAHPPITPCKAVDPMSISDDRQRKVYILVVKHYLACCSRDAIGRETTLTVRLGGAKAGVDGSSSEEFTAKGLMILERNWLEIYQPWERWSTGQGELPRVSVGSRIRPHSFLMKEGRTTAPQPISEVELISLMDRNGIGTDATIATHISTIQDREYAMKDANQKFLPTKLGIALVEGYNSMGYQLNKPDLRRETEAECNLVAAGQKTKEQIVGPILAKMKECYQTATAEATKLDEAMARHFSRLGRSNQTSQVIQQQFSKCGACNDQMALKQELQARGGGNNGTRRKLLYCNTCRVGFNLPRGTLRPKTHNDIDGGPPVQCPICSFQVIQVLRGEGYDGSEHHVCPNCLSNPPIEHGGSANGGEFRCFSCHHPTCALASGTPGGDVQVFVCPFCHPSDNGRNAPSQNATDSSQGQVCLRKNSRGYVLSCNTYGGGQDRCPYTIWLPKECQTASVPTGDENQQNNDPTVCTRCSVGNRIVRKVHFVWKPGSVPPQYGRELTVCVLCDVDFRRDLQVSLPQPGQVIPGRQRTSAGRGGGGGAARSGRGRDSGRGGRGAGGRGAGGRGRGGNTGGAGGGGNACYVCGQSGHFANNCPNNGGGGRGDSGGRGGGGGGTACYVCGMPGHFANACPNR